MPRGARPRLVFHPHRQVWRRRRQRPAQDAVPRPLRLAMPPSQRMASVCQGCAAVICGDRWLWLHRHAPPKQFPEARELHCRPPPLRPITGARPPRPAVRAQRGRLQQPPAAASPQSSQTALSLARPDLPATHWLWPRRWRRMNLAVAAALAPHQRARLPSLLTARDQTQRAHRLAASCRWRRSYLESVPNTGPGVQSKTRRFHHPPTATSGPCAQPPQAKRQ